jgi:tRNA (guanine37-N1)-methyltransferase
MISFEIITLFPNFFSSPLRESILGKAQENDFIRVRVHNIRDHAEDKHHTCDDSPYGGGFGMVLKPEPVVKALEKARNPQDTSCAILLTPQGEPFDQAHAEHLLTYSQIILLCGRYEGFDERIRCFVDREISIGDYVICGGETAALVLLEAVSRLVPGVLGKHESTAADSFVSGLLEYPQYTRPRDFRGHGVPEILFSGDHQKIEDWRLRESFKRTLLKRPDLLRKRKLSSEEELVLEEIKQEFSRSREDIHESIGNN